MQLYYDNIGYGNWATFIREHLYENGFGYIWEQQGVANTNLFLLEYVDRLKAIYVQNWYSRCRENNKLSYYVTFKNNYNVAMYVNSITINKFRSCMANLRCSSHTLMIEKCRHYHISREFRTCPYCETLVEDEQHFVLVCPLYSTLRSQYIPEHFFNNNTIDSFIRLMASKDETTVRNLAVFIYYAFKIRNEFFNGRI